MTFLNFYLIRVIDFIIDASVLALLYTHFEYYIIA